MRLTEFGNCVQITFFPGIFPVNCYLVKEADGLTLVDTGIARSWKGIQQAAAQLGLPILRILLTHGHSDHVGALDALHDSLPEADVLISKRDKRLLQGNTALDEGEPQTKINGGIKKCRTAPSSYLEAGDRVGSLEVISSPGHTPGHMAFLDLRDRTLLAGDAFQLQGGIAVSGMLRPFFPFPALATWHKPTALESAKRLRDVSPSYLAVGHGNVLHNPTGSMSNAILEAERKWRT